MVDVRSGGHGTNVVLVRGGWGWFRDTSVVLIWGGGIYTISSKFPTGGRGLGMSNFPCLIYASLFSYVLNSCMVVRGGW